MSCRTELRDAAAEAFVETIGEMDDAPALQFSNNGGAAVTLVGDVGPGNMAGGEQLEADVEEDLRTFYIPRQHNDAGTLIFPPDENAAMGGIRIESEITYEGDVWTVLSVSDGGVGAVFELTATRTQPTRLGVK